MKFGKSIFKTFFLSLCVIANTSFAYAQNAAILPPAKTTFFDQNGKPLTSGTVDFYVPGTTTRKTTWQDAAETIPNTNPVVLDSAGRAIVLGSGSYRQVVKDRNSNLIWDQVTASAGSGGGGSTTFGDGLLVGSILPWSGIAAPSQYQFAYGQAISRITYSQLMSAITVSASISCIGGSPIINVADTSNFTVGTKLETTCILSPGTVVSKTPTSVTLDINANITMSATGLFFPYGDGDGSTTFNAPDLRGYVLAGRTNMGGVTSTNLTASYFSLIPFNDPAGLNAKGGNQSAQLSTPNLPAQTPSGTITNGAITITGTGTAAVGTSTSDVTAGSVVSAIPGSLAASQAASTFTGTAFPGQTATPYSIVQPTQTINYIIKVTPDLSSSTSVVTDINGMTGSILCGAGLLCASNTVSCPNCVLGPSTYTAGAPIFGTGASNPALVAGTKTGNTNQVASTSGSFVQNNCLTTDANHNVVDTGSQCNLGTTTANVQDFIAGIDFTAGTTTSLTTSATPISYATSSVYFDGRLQSANTWSLSGSIFTFNAAIPSTTQVVEIRVLSTSVIPPWVASVENLLPNSQWDLWSMAPQPKTNSSGTAVQTQATCASFTTANTNPTFTCANTQAIRANDIVVSSIDGFWGFAGAGYITCASGKIQCGYGPYTSAARVTTLTTNTSIVLASPGFGGVSPVASVSSSLLPIAPGANSTTTNAADGWRKTSTLYATVDDWGTSALPASTAYPGCQRPLLLRKTITGQEIWAYDVPQGLLNKYRGRTVTFGAVVYQRVQGGASTFNLHIDDSTGSSASSNGLGSALGGYQFLTVTRTIAQNATSISIYFNLLGNSGDVFDVCLPTAAFAPSLNQYQLKQNVGEVIRAQTHWNPPLLTPLIINFPSTELVVGSGLYGWNGIDLEAISLGVVSQYVGNVYSKLEWTTSTLGALCFTGANTNASATGGLTFGLQASTQVVNIMFPTNMGRWPVWHDGTVTIFSNISGLVMSSGQSGTFDFTDVDTTPAISRN